MGTGKNDSRHKTPPRLCIKSLRGSVFSFAGILLFILSFLYFRGTQFIDPDKVVVHFSSTPRQPLVKIVPDFLPTNMFHSLQSAMIHHPRIVANELDADNFKYTRGWVAKFNSKGLDRLKTIPDMEAALQYLLSVQSNRSNAFVMNLLIADSSPYGEEAIGAHRDDTVGILNDDTFFAHQVNVLYVQIPKGMRGGQLEVWRDESEDSGADAVIVYPVENLMVEFKGTGCHRVGGFYSPSGQPRMSLVLEQYRIPSKYYKDTIVYCMNDCP